MNVLPVIHDVYSEPLLTILGALNDRLRRYTVKDDKLLKFFFATRLLRGNRRKKNFFFFVWVFAEDS